MLTPKLQMLHKTLERLIRRGAKQQLERVAVKTRAEDLAYLLPHFSEGERVQLLEACPSDRTRAEVLAEADPVVAGRLVARLPREQAVELLHLIEPDDASDILETLPDQQASDLLTSMRGEDRDEVEELSRYEPNSAGGIMSPRFFAINRDTTAQAAIEHLQKHSHELEMVFYVYVVNEVGQLLGVVSLRQLVTTKADTTLFELMTSDVISVHTDEDQEEVAKIASRYGLLAVPVVDDSNKLIGIVTVDDVLDVLQEEATEDILRMAGAGDELGVNHGLLRSMAQRLPWLLIVAVGGFVGAALLVARPETGPAFRLLAVLVPLVLGLGGATALQGATLMTQNITQERLGARLARMLVGQLATGIALGALFGLLIAAACWALLPTARLASGQDSAVAALWIGAGVAVAMTWASSVGAALPLLFRRTGIDPALAAGPLGAIAAEVSALALYLLVASRAL